MSETRAEQWKRELLDLSLRNPLLNVRDGSKFLPLEEGVPYAGGAATTAVVPYMPPEAGESLPFKTRLPEKEIRKRLKELYLTSRSMYNESGVNSRFLAVGFLSWHEKEGEDFHQAPLILIPAQLIQQTVVVQPVTQVQNVWVEGRYVDTVRPNGLVVRTWQAGHYEQQVVTMQ